MLSLQDDIKKFDKCIYNKELSAFITIDEMFTSGGITMQSLIKENNFIVEELKKFTAVFKNYCKLNDKVYSKIIEHQLNLHKENDKLNNLVSGVDRRINQTIKVMRQLFQDTTQQNTKSKHLLQQLVDPLKLEISQKVDNSTFSVKMKQILDQYDDQEQSVVYGENGEVISGPQGINGEVNNNGQAISSKKRGRNAGLEELENIKKQLQEKITSQSLKLQQSTKITMESKDLLIKYIGIINKNVQQTQSNDQQIRKLNSKTDEQLIYVNTTSQKILSQLNSKINENVWQLKFDNFNEKQLRPNVNHLLKVIADHDKQNSKHFLDINQKNIQVDSKINQHNKNIAALAEKNQKQEGQLQSIRIILQNDHEKHQAQQVLIYNKIQEEKLFILNNASLKIKELNLEIDEIQQLIKNLASIIEETVLKAVSKKTEAQMKLIEKDIKETKSNVKEVQRLLTNSFEQITSIKDILSKKANFTDLIMQFEKKADKEDIRELKGKMTETSHTFIGQTQRLLGNTLDRGDLTKRKTSLSKSIMARTPSLRTENQTTKLYMCGFDDQIPENRPIFSQNGKRKSMKSSVIFQ